MFDQIRDFGPVYGFWSFTVERLNKVLKSYQTNNHNGGELEVTFMREYFRDVRIHEIMSSCSSDEAYGQRVHLASRLILATENDIRGTVASLSKDIDGDLRGSDGNVLFKINGDSAN